MYLDFAQVYDQLTQDIDYEKLADYVEALFLCHHVQPELVLDLACGTGSLALSLARRGYEMIGIDASQEMLAVAMEKKIDSGLDVLLLNQDMRSFELYGTVGAILCTLDGINYITRTGDLERVISLVHNYLDPNGLFVFDINTLYKLSQALPTRPNYEIADDIVWIWHSTYDEERCICTFDLTFFEEQENGSYQRFDETHEERAYQASEICQMLEKCGFHIEAIYDGHTLDAPRADSERLSFVARAIKPI